MSHRPGASIAAHPLDPLAQMLLDLARRELEAEQQAEQPAPATAPPAPAPMPATAVATNT